MARGGAFQAAPIIYRGLSEPVPGTPRDTTIHREGTEAGSESLRYTSE